MYNLLILVLLLLVQTAEELGRNNIIMEGMRDILADARLYSAELSTMPWYDNPETVETQLREIEMERIEEEKRIKAIERAERQAIEEAKLKAQLDEIASHQAMEIEDEESMQSNRLVF